VALAACAPRSSAGPSPLARRNEDIVYSDEIAAAGVTDAYEAILALRPRYIAARDMPNARGGSGVRIVVDGLTQPRVDDLRSVRAAEIVYIRYLSAIEASTYWGGNINTPVVYVLTRAGPGAGAVRR
jgi:hypothetical protein